MKQLDSPEVKSSDWHLIQRIVEAPDKYECDSLIKEIGWKGPLRSIKAH
jgi:hypothetical protein